MKPKFAVIGKTGQLAQALALEFDKEGYSATLYGREELDLANSVEAITNFLEGIPEFDVMIIAAAYTAVDNAERDMATALAVNGRAPGVIAEFCGTRNIPIVHISTDYVFNGKGAEPYTVKEKTDPVNYYGHTKRVGELNIQATGCRHAIIRTSWVFDGTGKNFLTTMLRLAETKDDLNIVGDQRGRPTYAGHLAKAAISASKGLIADIPGSSDIFHFSNSGPIISWAEFAQAIFRANNLNVLVNFITTEDYPMPAKRPAFSALNTRKFETVFDYTPPSWQEGLSAALAERVKRI